MDQILNHHYTRFTSKVELNRARVLVWLALGGMDDAVRWAEACRSGSELEQITLARLRLAQGKATEALKLLNHQRELAKTGGRIGRLIEILLLQALAYDFQSQASAAKAALAQALSLARSEGYVRMFLDLGQPLYDLLNRFVTHRKTTKSGCGTIMHLTEDYVRELLRAFQQEDGIQIITQDQTLVSPLTERELEVLRFLAEGKTNKVIADLLVVAPSTVKQHLKNIYGKLGVHNRTQAVVRGRELDLL